ncbi:MAG: anthranilate synthase component I, partial [Acidobacteriota bacterium]|nr:anthranilate synthase component I [Acidobacteriota bacterium]
MSAGAERAAASAARPGGSGSAGAAAASVRTLMPVTESFIDDCQTPVSAFLKLRALAPGEPAFLLESAEQGNYVGRWSFIGLAPRDLLRWSLADGGDPYALAEQFVGRFRQAPMDAPPPFTGGAVGYFGYDLVRTVEPLGEPGPDPIGLPDMALMLADVLVIFDHLKHTVTVLAHAEQDGGEAGGAAGAANGGPTGERDGSRAARPPADARERIAQIRAALQGPIPASGRGEHGEPRPTEVPRFEP